MKLESIFAESDWADFLSYFSAQGCCFYSKISSFVFWLIAGSIKASGNLARSLTKIDLL